MPTTSTWRRSTPELTWLNRDVVRPGHLGDRGRQREDLWPVYLAVFGDRSDYGEWRTEVWDRHTGRSGFRLARAYRRRRRLVGFGYGYTGGRGQWWTDQAALVLDAAVADSWLGGHFELVTIGVLPEARGQGHGAGLMRVLTTGWLRSAGS